MTSFDKMVLRSLRVANWIGNLMIKEGSFTYTGMLFAAGIVLAGSGSTNVQDGWLLCWCGLGFVLVGLAYAR